MIPGGPIMWLWVALGAALGAVLRVGLGIWLPAGRLPWGTIAANILGSLLIGWLIGRLGGITAENARLQALLVAGFCGGFTTFSSFSWQTIELLQRGQVGWAIGHGVGSVLICGLATWLGWRMAVSMI